MYVIYWGAAAGAGAGASEGRVISEILEQWGRVKAFKFLKVRGGSCFHFRFRKHKICTIPNAFSAIRGDQISTFPGGTCPRIPPATECLQVHVNHVSIRDAFHTPVVHHVHVFHYCQFLTNLPQFGDTLRTSWHVSQILNIWSTATVFSFRIEIDKGALPDKNTNVIFAQRVAGTTFEDSVMTKIF